MITEFILVALIIFFIFAVISFFQEVLDPLLLFVELLLSFLLSFIAFSFYSSSNISYEKEVLKVTTSSYLIARGCKIFNYIEDDEIKFISTNKINEINLEHPVILRTKRVSPFFLTPDRVIYQIVENSNK